MPKPIRVENRSATTLVRNAPSGARFALIPAGDAEYQIKRRPLNALGVTFGIGLGLGAVIGVLLTRNGHCGK